MSIIQRIRDKAAWFVFGAIALSLLAFILQDAFSGRTSSLLSAGTTLGKVNGVAIDKNDFETELNYYVENQGAKREDIIGQLWDFMVDQKLMQGEFDKLGLQFTSKELSETLFGDNAPPGLKREFADPATGLYNKERAKQEFANLKKSSDSKRDQTIYRAYLQPAIEQGLRTKYQGMISGAIYVPKWLAEKTNANNNGMAKISYVSVPYTTISDSAVKVSDADIDAYVKKHTKQFEVKDETRQIEYVNFDASPSMEDSATLRATLNVLKEEFATTTDDKSFTERNASEMPFYASYLSKSAIKQQIKDSLFNMPVGGVYGPYLDGPNYVIAKIAGVKQWPDSAKVRHILVATYQQDPQSGQSFRIRQDEDAEKRLDSAIAEIKAGKSFDSVCAKYSDDGTKNTGGVYENFPTGQMVESFNEFAFDGAIGERKIVKTSYGMHYVEVLGHTGSQPAYKIAYLSKPILASQETINAANTAAIQFASSSKNKAQFDTNVAKLKMQPVTLPGIKENDFKVGDIADSRELVRWIYNNDPGDISVPFTIGDKNIVAIILSVSKPGLPSVATVKAQVEPLVAKEKKAQQIIAKLKGTSLQEISASANFPVQVADSIAYNSPFVPGLGMEPKVIGAAFNKQIQGKLSTPIAGNLGVFFVKGETIYTRPALDNNTEMMRSQMEMQQKQQVYTSLSALRQAADVKDYRSKFY